MTGVGHTISRPQYMHFRGCARFGSWCGRVVRCSTTSTCHVQSRDIGRQLDDTHSNAFARVLQAVRMKREKVAEAKAAKRHQAHHLETTFENICKN